MGYNDVCLTEHVAQPEEQLMQFDGRSRIEVPRRFIGEQDGRRANQRAGQHGALGSRLLKMLRAGHNDVQLSDSDLRRLAAWIDCNAVFHGTFNAAEQAKQLAGERLGMPEIQ